jgi:nucleotide-binding universal stress UspA family protein
VIAQEPDMAPPSETLEPTHKLQSGSPTPSAPFRRVAVCVDGSDMGEAVVLHAALAAAAFGVPLTILRVLETDSNANSAPSDPLDWAVRQREARVYLDRLVSLAGHRTVDVQSELMQGRAAEQICGWTLQHGADLTVLASHGEHGRSAWTLSSTARKLVDAVPGSLLVVPADGDRREGTAVRYRRIMVPLDGSARAESVLPIAMRLATVHEAELLIAHVTPAPELTKVGPLTAQDLELEQRVLARNERVARSYLDQIRARMSEAGIAARTVISRRGDARTGLARLVRREGVDLVILSAYGRRGPRDIPCGSVAAHLLTHLAVPLLVFRERPRRILKRMVQEAARRAASARPPTQAEP